MRKPDLKLDFDEILIPAVQSMLQEEDKHLEKLRLRYTGRGEDVILDRMIDLSMESSRLHRQRIQEYKKYSSELK